MPRAAEVRTALSSAVLMLPPRLMLTTESPGAALTVTHSTPRDDVGRRAAAGAVKYLDRHHFGARCHAHHVDIVVTCCCGASHMGAVAVAIVAVVDAARKVVA